MPASAVRKRAGGTDRSLEPNACVTVHALYLPDYETRGKTGTERAPKFEFATSQARLSRILPTRSDSQTLPTDLRPSARMGDAFCERAQASITSRAAFLGVHCSVENSENVSAQLNKLRWPHTVLNASPSTRVAKPTRSLMQAARRRFTIATNMAGPWEDIVGNAILFFKRF